MVELADGLFAGRETERVGLADVGWELAGRFPDTKEDRVILWVGGQNGWRQKNSGERRIPDKKLAQLGMGFVKRRVAD
jgi:hypothetical protein